MWRFCLGLKEVNRDRGDEVGSGSMLMENGTDCIFGRVTRGSKVRVGGGKVRGVSLVLLGNFNFRSGKVGYKVSEVTKTA